MISDETDMPDSGSAESNDMETTQHMSDSLSSAEEEQPKGKKPKKPGDWVTVEVPKAERPATSQPTAPPASAEHTVLESPSGAGAGVAPSSEPQQAIPSASDVPAPSQPSPVSAAPPSVTPSVTPSTPGGGFLSNLGINDPNTQRWVMIGGGIVIFLCCACACVAAALSVMNSGTLSAPSGLIQLLSML